MGALPREELSVEIGVMDEEDWVVDAACRVEIISGDGGHVPAMPGPYVSWHALGRPGHDAVNTSVFSILALMKA